MTDEPFTLVGPWKQAAETIARVMTESIDPRDLILPGGPASNVGIERYAREYVAASGRSNLALIYGIVSVGVCTSTQGGWVLECPVAGGGYLQVPPIQFFTGIAPSGYRKSTALDVARRVAQRVLAVGLRARTERSIELRHQQELAARERIQEDEGAGARIDTKQFAAVFNAGICPVTIVKDPTMEALQQVLVNNGGAGSVYSAEADIFRSMIAYNQDGGTLTPLLDGWSQETLSSSRVTRGHIEMDEVALNLVVLFQPEVFADVTGGVNIRGNNTDSFVSRGVFGRTWVVRAADLGGYEELADQYADELDFTYSGRDGMTDGATGEMTPLGAAMYDYERNCQDLVTESNVYRADKAIHRAWQLALAEHGADLQVREPSHPQRHRLQLTTKAQRLAYRRVQRMQLMVESALADDQVDEDVRDIFTPLAARITQHVMREALVMSLGAGYREVRAEFIEDAAIRIIPWRIAHSADALLTRGREVAAEAVRFAATSNPQGVDLSVEAVVRRQLASMLLKKPSALPEGFTRGQVREQVRSQLRRTKGTGGGIARLVQESLEKLAAKPDETGVTVVGTSVDAMGNPVTRYSFTDLQAASKAQL